jgi:hypothetical protein
VVRGWTEWDARVATRAAAVALLVLALAWLVTAMTDEGNVAWSERAGRSLPLAPICAAIGAWAALAAARARGDLRALAALGRSDWENARAPVFGGALVAVVAGAAIAWAPSVDVAGFYPEIVRGADARFDGEANAFVDPQSGWRIAPDGALTLGPALGPVREERVPRHGRAAAGFATAVAGLAMALATARREEKEREEGKEGGGRRAAWLGATVLTGAATVFLFQCAAARLLAAGWATVPPLALLAAAAACYRASSWRAT